MHAHTRLHPACACPSRPRAVRRAASCMTYAPDTKHPTPGAVGRDIPVETVVARYSGQLYSMPEFEDALFEKTTTGDYAFGLPLAGIEGRLSPLGCPLVVVRRLQRDPLAVPVVRFITLSLSLPLLYPTGWVIDGENPETSSWSRYVNHSLRRQNCHAFPG